MKNAHLLLIEDNEGDIILAKEALNDAQIVNKVTVIQDGSQAIEFLYHQAKINPIDLPDLILLDINLPRLNGMEVLKAIKENDTLLNIPVVIVSTSSSPNEVEEAYRLKANNVITKPLNRNKIFRIIRGIEKIGISMVLLPANN